MDPQDRASRWFTKDYRRNSRKSFLRVFTGIRKFAYFEGFVVDLSVTHLDNFSELKIISYPLNNKSLQNNPSSRRGNSVLNRISLRMLFLTVTWAWWIPKSQYPAGKIKLDAPGPATSKPKFLLPSGKVAKRRAAEETKESRITCSD